MFGSVGAVVLGVLLGLRHALEPDHLTAVSTLVVDARTTRGGAWLGAIWGVGHTVSLVAVGSILLATGAVLPVRAAASFELLVAAMLVVLGVLAIRRAHAGAPHHHHAPVRHARVAGWSRALRPLVVGLVHGLAGSGAMTALVLAALPTSAARVTYIALFGLGSIAGMALASGVAGASLRRISTSATRRRSFGIATGMVSIGVGIAWAIPELALL